MSVAVEGDSRYASGMSEASTGAWRRLRDPATWAVIGAAVSLLVALARFDPLLFTGGDNVHYYALAEALATGRGYVDLVAPGAPAHTQYPPGYPALLVPFHLLSGGSIVSLKLVSWLAGGALLGAVWSLARRDPAVPGWIAAAAVWGVGLFGAFQLYAHRALSDMPYVALVTWTLAVVQPVGEDEGDDRLDVRWLGGCGLALAAFTVRTAGVTILAGLVAWALAKGRWRRGGIAAFASASAVAGWFAWTRRGGAEGAVYLEQLASTNPLDPGGEARGWTATVSGLAERFGETAVEYATYQFPQLFWPIDPPPPPARAFALVVGGALLAWGAWTALRRRGASPWDGYVLATLALLPFWPWLGDRYVLTLVPFLWIWILLGLDDLAGRLFDRTAVAIGAAGVVVAILLGHALAAVPDQWPRTRAWLRGDELAGYDPFWSDYFESARWIGRSTPPDAIVLARKPRLAWFWSRRPAVTYPEHARPEVQWRFIRDAGVTHILFEPYTKEALGEALLPHQDLLAQVHEAPMGRALVFALSHGARP